MLYSSHNAVFNVVFVLMFQYLMLHHFHFELFDIELFNGTLLDLALY